MMIGSIGFSIAGLYLTFDIIPQCAVIYHDMLPENQPLPVVTTLALQGRWMFVALAVFWPLAALREIRRRTAWFLFALMTISVIEVLFILIALFIPLVGIIKAMSGTG